MDTSQTTPPAICTTCRSEIVATVNDSLFRDGECNACEYQRYRSQPELLAALDRLLDVTFDADLSGGVELTDRERLAWDDAIAAIANAYGQTP